MNIPLLLMAPEEQILFACTRQQLTEPHQQTILTLSQQHKIDWPLVYKIAELHGVAPLIYVNLRQLSTQNIEVPAPVMQQFEQRLLQNMFTKERRAQNVSAALDFFGKRSIDVMLVKGGALDVLVYNQPYYTVSLDVDLLLNLPRTEVSPELFRHFMDVFHGRGIEYDYYEHHDINMNGVLSIDFHQIWQHAELIDYRGQDVYVMCPEDMLITLCINSCRKRFFRLKSLCDIAETLHKYPNLQWPRFIGKATAYGCGNIVYAALCVTRMTVGCTFPEDLHAALGVGFLRRNLLDYISQNGSLSAFSSLYAGKSLLGRNVDWSLLLTYAAFNWQQTARRLRFTALYTREGAYRLSSQPGQ